MKRLKILSVKPGSLSLKQQDPFDMKLRYASLILIVLFGSSCGMLDPCGSDKTDYLKKMEQLVDSAKKESDKASPDFASLDERFIQLSEACFDQWEADMDLGEKTRVAQWIIEYNYQKLAGKKLKDILE
jgi:hypothetical protein